MVQSFSVRAALHGTLHEYAESSGFRCVATENLLREIVSLLASYREEDVPLFPDVFVLANRADLNLLSPGVGSHKIGVLPFASDAAVKLLKNAAGLAADGWADYVSKVSADTIEYGMFRSQRHSFATSADESMQDLGDAVPVIAIHNRGHLTVELVNSKKEVCIVTLTTAVPVNPQMAGHLQLLAQAAASKLSGDARQRFEPYFARLMIGMLQRCHGTLIGVLHGSAGSPPSAFGDGVWVTPPINLAECLWSAIAQDNSTTLSDLQAAESLLNGMINSDGIVMLGADGTIRGYRVFMTPKVKERKHIPDKGGGRRRTFSLMKLRVNNGDLAAAFFRSQDGETDCVRGDK